MRSFKNLWLQRATERGWKLLSAVALTALTVLGGTSTAAAADQYFNNTGSANWGGNVWSSSSGNTGTDARVSSDNATIESGTVELDSSNHMTPAGAVTVKSGANIDIESVGSLQSTSLQPTSVDNSGNININASNGNASLSASGTITNNGNISVSADGTSVASFGINVNSGTLTNNNMITLTSTNGGMVEFSHGTVINNGTINVEGDGDGSIATGVVFNSDTLGGTGWVNVNSGYLMASGDNPNFAFTNNSNICLNGGKMSVGNLGTNVGVFKFNLTQYAGKAAEQAGGADTAGKEIVTVRVGGTADFTGKTDANLILTGGTKDKYYGLFSAATGYDGIATSYASKYLFGTENGNLWVQYLGADANAIVEAADAASSSNDSIAHFIVDNYDNLPAELRDKLDEITDAGKLGRALTELNGTNSQTAQAQASLNASHQFNAALGQVFGDTFAANLVRGNTNNAQFGGRSSAGGKPTGATGAGAGYVTGFVKAYGGFGSQGSTHAAAGYDFGGVGVLVGSGYKFANELELGALFGYSWNKAESYGNYGENTDNILRLGLYGNYAYDNLFFNTAPTFGIHLINTERNTILGTAKSDRTGFDFSWFNRLGYTFELPADFYLTPSYALSMTYFRDPSHSEYGTGSVSSRFGDYDQWSLVQNLELRVGKLFRVSDCFALLPEIWGGWEHEYINNNNTVAQSFTTVQGNWVAPVKAIAQDRAVLGVGLTTIIKNKYEVYGRYDERLWDGGHASQFTLGLSVKF